MVNETPILFQCHDDNLLGIVHHADKPSKIGVLLLVGGSQYRVGSHRQFVLLARMLAANGVPVMRFDYRGMGDSEGDTRAFDAVDDDIAGGMDAFLAACPELSGVVIWGLCDAASAALFYAYQDERVKGLVLLNPWVFTEKGAAKTYLKHYYLPRLFSRELWHKIVNLKFEYLCSLVALITLFKRIIRKGGITASYAKQIDLFDRYLDLPSRMRECMRRFKHPIAVILSGKDLTADEFKEAVKSDREWQKLLQANRVSHYGLIDADHTFSSAAWRDQVALWTLAWVKGLMPNKN